MKCRSKNLMSSYYCPINTFFVLQTTVKWLKAYCTRTARFKKYDRFVILVHCSKMSLEGTRCVVEG